MAVPGGGWVSRRRRSANQAFSGQRGAISVMERFRVSLTGHYPVDQTERWKCVHVEMIPRVGEGVFEDGLRVWDH